MYLACLFCSFNNSRSLGSDSVFLTNDEQEECLDTEDEVSGFSTDSEAPGPSCRRFLRVPSKKKKTVEKWDGCAGCVPRRRPGGKPCQACRSISAAVETSRYISRLLRIVRCRGFSIFFTYAYHETRIKKSLYYMSVTDIFSFYVEI